MNLPQSPAVIWIRHEGRIDGRGFALVADGRGWTLLLDGHGRGTFTGPDALVNAIDALPAISAEYPPEHPHAPLTAEPGQ